MVTTVTDVTVTEVIAGDLAVGDTISVSQLGGSPDSTTYIEDSTTLLEDVDSPAVMLLLAEHEGQPFDLINPVDGVLEVHGDTVTALPGSGSALTVRSVREVKELADS